MLYIIATPIGNLEDITMRALRILGEVDFILAEDTRVTRKLLNHYEIKTKTISFHEHSKPEIYEKIAENLSEGKSFALVTDAGTPGVSDPGAKLVNYVRANLPEIKIEPIPGASALTTLLSVSGILEQNYKFIGFIPKKKGRQTFFENLAHETESGTRIIFFESGHRIMKMAESLNDYYPDHEIIVGKELTKIHEDVMIGKPAEIFARLEEKDKTKGEFVVIF